MRAQTQKFYLYGLSGIRMVVENFWAWGILGGIYSLALANVFQGWVEATTGVQMRIQQLAPVLVAMLAIPLFFRLLSSSWGLHFYPPAFALKGALGRWVLLSITQEWRRPYVYLFLAGVVLAFFLFIPLDGPGIVFGPLFINQYFISGVQNWRKIALFYFPQNGARYLIASTAVNSLMGAFVFSIVMKALHGPIESRWLFSAWGGVVAGSALSLDGDSGRPGLVQFVTLAGSLIGVLVTRTHPFLFLVVLYFSAANANAAKERIRSVESIDEDGWIA